MNFFGKFGSRGTSGQVEKEWGGADSDDSDDAATSIAKAGGVLWVVKVGELTFRFPPKKTWEKFTPFFFGKDLCKSVM